MRAGHSTTLELPLLVPDWPAPKNVRAVATTRLGGVSEGPYSSLNLAYHTGDAADSVGRNRQHLLQVLGLCREPAWLNQVHGSEVIDAERSETSTTADAAFCHQPGQACVVMTADCLPVLLCDREGTCVAAAHAGWRGLAAGVVEATVAAVKRDPTDLLAWLGPAIGPEAFEVGEEVRTAFVTQDRGASDCFLPSPAGRWLADIYQLARRRLHHVGVSAVYGGGWCTVSESERFFSYRRDRATGRMATLIWLTKGSPKYSCLKK